VILNSNMSTSDPELRHIESPSGCGLLLANPKRTVALQNCFYEIDIWREFTPAVAGGASVAGSFRITGKLWTDEDEHFFFDKLRQTFMLLLEDGRSCEISVRGVDGRIEGDSLKDAVAGSEL
jgi:hypothetical protein